MSRRSWMVSKFCSSSSSCFCSSFSWASTMSAELLSMDLLKSFELMLTRLPLFIFSSSFCFFKIRSGFPASLKHFITSLAIGSSLNISLASSRLSLWIENQRHYMTSSLKASTPFLSSPTVFLSAAKDFFNSSLSLLKMC